MIIYFIVGLIASFGMHQYQKNKKTVFLVISFLCLFIISAFRYGIGYDYLNIYVPIFNKICNGINVSWDFGILILCKFISIFTNDYLYFFIITAFITILYIYKGILKNSDIPWLSVLIFVFSGDYVASFNIVRQYIAVAIFLYSIQYIINKDFKKYCICILFSFLMHNSAIILLPVYYIGNIKKGFFKQIIIMFLSVILLNIFSQLFYYFLSFFKYSSYLNTKYDTFNPSYSEIILSVVNYLAVISQYKKYKNDKKYITCMNISLLFMILAIFSFKIILSERILLYFRAIQILTYPYIISKITNAKKRLFAIILCSIYFASLFLIGGYFFGWYDTKYISIIGRR